MLFAGVLLAGLAWIGHLSETSHRPSARHVLVSLAIVALGIALSRADGSAAALIGCWTFIAGEELWAWRNVLPNRLIRAKNGPPRLSSSGPPVSSGTATEAQELVEPAADVMQLTLRTTAEGGQELSGWLRMPLAAGQRSGTLHVAFCPPFDCAPDVEVEAVAGPDCRVKTADVLPYGVRLEIKLGAPAVEEESVLCAVLCRSHPCLSRRQ